MAGCYAGRGIYRNLPSHASLSLAAEQNLPEACYNLGYYLQRTEAGITANLKEAELWFGRAAELNFAPGQFALAFINTTAQVSVSIALKPFVTSNRGTRPAEAQGYLGLMYLKGQGTPESKGSCQMAGFRSGGGFQGSAVLAGPCMKTEKRCPWIRSALSTCSGFPLCRYSNPRTNSGSAISTAAGWSVTVWKPITGSCYQVLSVALTDIPTGSNLCRNSQEQIDLVNSRADVWLENVVCGCIPPISTNEVIPDFWFTLVRS